MKIYSIYSDLYKGQLDVRFGMVYKPDDEFMEHPLFTVRNDLLYVHPDNRGLKHNGKPIYFLDKRNKRYFPYVEYSRR